jgi:Fe2+ or Zn2+ uptake regulation protein
MTEKAPIRVTQPTLKIARFLAELKTSSTWGLQICAETQLGSGSVYSVLDRFESYGWVESFSLQLLVAEKESISILIQSRAKVQA